MTAAGAGGVDVQVRDVAGTDELRACQQLQKRTWGITEDGYLLPVATLAAAQKMGGSVLGAFRGGALVGFTFAFLGRYRGGELTLYSQLAAIDPAHQGAGIGRQLKLAQRQRALELGLGSVTWTFDPLQAKNAAFNLATLGARGIAYETDLYGNRTDPLNAGLATDRLVVQWPTRGPLGGEAELDPELDRLVRSSASHHAASSRPIRGSFPESRERAHDVVLIESPADIATLKQREPDRAKAWQCAVRDAFQGAFAEGLVVTGFVRDRSRGRAFYVLRRSAPR